MNEISAVLAVAPADPTNVEAAELSAEKLTVRFQVLAAFSDVSLTVRRHEVFGLIGSTGAGKTTLVNCLPGFQAPTEGRILVGRQSTTGWEPTRFREMGIARTFQAGRLFKEMSVLEHAAGAAVGLGLNRRKAIAHSHAILDWVGLADKMALPAGALAYTDQRRLGIARAMVLPPAFVLLDEPAAGMSDAEG